MKFSCQKADIASKIQNALEFTSQRNSLSILSNVLLKAHDGILEIKATDQKVGYYSTIEVSVEDEGMTTVICDKFLSIIKLMPDEELTFDDRDSKFTIYNSSGKIHYELKTIASDSFPELERIDDSLYFRFAQKDFTQMINQTISSVSQDESKYFINGVFLENTGTSLVMVATDGKRLSFIEKQSESPIPAFKSSIIPQKFLNELKKMSSGEGLFELAITDSIIFARFGETTIYSSLVKGNFPNYKKVIPPQQPNAFRCSVSDMLEALKRVALMVEDKSNKIILTVSDGELQIKSVETDIGRSDERIACALSSEDGDSFEIGINLTYLTNSLKTMDSKEFTLSFFSEGLKAMTLRPEPASDYFHIIMPMQV